MWNSDNHDLRIGWRVVALLGVFFFVSFTSLFHNLLVFVGNCWVVLIFNGKELFPLVDSRLCLNYGRNRLMLDDPRFLRSVFFGLVLVDQNLWLQTDSWCNKLEVRDES